MVREMVEFLVSRVAHYNRVVKSFVISPRWPAGGHEKRCKMCDRCDVQLIAHGNA